MFEGKRRSTAPLSVTPATNIDSGISTKEPKKEKRSKMTSEHRADESAMEARFEVLEEETHYPASHPQSAAAKQQQQEDADAAAAERQQQEEEEEEETLEAKLDKLMLGEDEKNVKNASKAKELGNECA